MVKKLTVKGIIIFLLILVIILLGWGINISKKYNNLIASTTESNAVKLNNNALTMMLETDVNSNEYEVATSNEWPQEGYIFNAEMSACERGGKLSWDSENNRVVMASGSADKCYVYFDKYTTVKITNVTTSNITNNSITLTVEATAGESQIATYYFSNNDGLNYEKSSTNTYTFNNLTMGTEYNFRVYAVDTNGISSNVYALNETTLSTIYFADYIKNVVYTGDGNEGIYYHDGSGTYTNAAQEAGDNSYRYAGANPNNYVCFGSDEATCPEDNLYRIIGVFGDQIKLIKHDYVNSNMLGTDGDFYNSSYLSKNSTSDYYKGSQDQSDVSIYYWSRTGINTWSESQLNMVNLNTNYLNYLNGINTKWNDMIEMTSWIVGGASDANISSSPVKIACMIEIVSPVENITYDAKIGLMYVSDYGYAASPENWTTILGYGGYNNSTATSNNWMYMGLSEWTISRKSDDTYEAFFVGYGGDVSSYNVEGVMDMYGYFTVRPTFYLKSNVALTSGNGTSTNPFRIELA